METMNMGGSDDNGLPVHPCTSAVAPREQHNLQHYILEKPSSLPEKSHLVSQSSSLGIEVEPFHDAMRCRS